ncbi:MAG: primosome assembly protein PriA, partial [Ornithinimicrobium sp.]
WLALPGRTTEGDWPGAIAEAVAATRRSGRGSVVVVPDQRDLAAVSAALDRVLGHDAHVQLSAEHGPSVRYTAWLSLLRGHHNVVVGTRSAAYAPVQRPGLFVLWDELDDLHREPRTPYPHVREVLRIRAADTGAGVLLGGFVRSVETARALTEGRVRSVHAATDVVRAAMPAISVAGEGHEMSRDGAAHAARLPSQAWRAISTGLGHGSVLVQVPRRGYLLALSCARCRHRLHCATCQGPVQLDGPDDAPRCAWCGAAWGETPCPECASTTRRSGVIGERRTAYEIGRAFPGVEVRSSTAGQILPAVTGERIIVVATPGAEPVAYGGYATTVLMDGWALADRAGLDSPLEALRRWTAAAALTRGRSQGGQVVLVGVPAHGGVRSVEALLRWDPAYLADSELTERQELGLPPLRRMASFTGDLAALRRVSDDARRGSDVKPAPIEVLGPLRQKSGGSQLLVRTATGNPSSSDEHLLLDFVRQVRVQRSMSKATDSMRIRVDPLDSAL